MNSEYRQDPSTSDPTQDATLPAVGVLSVTSRGVEDAEKETREVDGPASGMDGPASGASIGRARSVDVGAPGREEEDARQVLFHRID